MTKPVDEPGCEIVGEYAYYQNRRVERIVPGERRTVTVTVTVTVTPPTEHGSRHTASESE